MVIFEVQNERIMKKALLITLISFLTSVSFAQFNFPLDTVEVSLEYDKLKSVYIMIDNSQSSEDLEYTWTEVDRDLNTNWEVQFCDCRTCYSNYHIIPEDTSVACDNIYKINAGDVFSGFAMYVNPFNTDDEGFLTVDFEQIRGNATGRVTFRARFTPTSSQELKDVVNQFKIYPNPATDIVNLSVDTDTSIDGVQIRVVDLLGKEVKNQRIPVGTTLFQMNSSDLNTGIYFVQLTNLKGDVLMTKKLIKN